MAFFSGESRGTPLVDSEMSEAMRRRLGEVIGLGWGALALLLFLCLASYDVNDPSHFSATPEPPSASLPTWKGLLLRHLERHKRYPHEAQRARQEGVTYVRFTMSRDGRILAARIERASGVASLDQEGLDLLRRAQPLPPLPSDQPGESLELLVPVQFYLKR